VFVPASDATTLSDPPGAVGTVKVHADPVVPGNEPVESVVHVEAAGRPAKVKPIVEFAANPVPVVATRVPTTPLTGDKARPGLTVNFATAVLVPSEADTVIGPTGAVGTVKVHGDPPVPGKLPFGSVEHVVVTVTPPKTRVIEEFGRKRVPEALTRLPTAPRVGASARLALTVKGVVARFGAATAMTVTLLEAWSATKTLSEPESKVAATGPPWTAIVATTASVASETTLTLFEPWFATNTSSTPGALS
jgi:hypothetical protein